MPILTECLHKELYFGSGDYYVICAACWRYWVMIDDQDSIPAAHSHNIGAAAGLSGERRIEPETR